MAVPRTIPPLLALLLTGAIPCAAPAARPPAPLPRLAQAEDADEEYQFLVGLCERGMWKLAVERAEAFLAEHPRHGKAALARYRLATALFELDRGEQAAPHFRQLARDAQFEFAAECWFRLGQCELGAGRLEQARAALAQVLAREDAAYLHVVSTFLTGEAAFRGESWGEAEEHYGAVLKAEPEGGYAAHAGYGLVWCAFRLGRWDDAAQLAAGFRARWPLHELILEVCFVEGEAHLEAGRPAEALTAYDRVQEGPFADAALRGVGFARAAQEDHRRAAGAFALLLERFPQSRFAPEAALHRGIHLLRLDRHAAAVASLSVPALAQSPEALLWLARAQRAGGESEAALATLERALGMEAPAELVERLRIARGDLLFELGRGAEAAAEYERAESDYALHAAAVASLNGGRHDEALRLARALLEEYPESAYRMRAWLAAGEALLARGEHDEAGAAFAAVLAPESDAPADQRARARSRLAWCRYLAGEPAAAAVEFERLLQQQAEAEEAPEARYMLGRCRAESGDAQGAVEAYGSYLAEHPRGEYADEALLRLSRLDGESAHLQRLLRDHGESGLRDQALYELAEALATEGQHDRAAARYRELIDGHPASELVPAARYGLAWCRLEAGDPAEAVEELELLLGGEAERELHLSAIELLVWAARDAGNPDAAARVAAAFAGTEADEARRLECARTAARALTEAGRHGAADELLAQVAGRLNSSASRAALAVERTWLALDTGRLEDAEKRVRAALAAAPAEPAVLEVSFFVGEACFDAGRDAAALELYRSAAPEAGSPVLDKALYKAGFTCLRGGDAAGAEAGFARLVAETPHSELWGESLFLLGESLFRQERYAEAVAHLRRLEAEMPEHDSIPRALFRRGLCHGQLLEWKPAADTLGRLVKRHPQFPNLAEAELWRGRALASLDNARAARQAFDRVLALDKGALAARARLEIARLHLAAGRTEDALAEFLKVAFLYAHAEEVSEALWEAGRCLEALGDPAAARRQYSELLERFSGSSWAPAAQERLDALEAEGSGPPK